MYTSVKKNELFKFKQTCSIHQKTFSIAMSQALLFLSMNLIETIFEFILQLFRDRKAALKYQKLPYMYFSPFNKIVREQVQKLCSTYNM